MKHEVRGKALPITLHGLIQRLDGHAVEWRQILVEHHVLSPDSQHSPFNARGAHQRCLGHDAGAVHVLRQRQSAADASVGVVSYSFEMNTSVATTPPATRVPGTTVVGILAAISLSHLLNDTIQSLI